MTITFGPEEVTAADSLIALALEEDLGEAGDLTGQALIDPEATGRVAVRNRQPGTVAGLPVLARVFETFDSRVAVRCQCHDGQALDADSVLAELDGPIQALLAAERTALNFLGHLSGIASTTAAFVAEVAGSGAVVLDTRKTLPGWRRLAKYAVRCGGGTNHRLGLYDGILVKDNHLAGRGAHEGEGEGVAGAVRAARAAVSGEIPVQVEVDTLEQLQDALGERPDLVLLDNMTASQLAEAVAIRDRLGEGVLLEASGGITLASVAEVARSGVDRISLGCLTHSAANWDVGFDWVD